MNKRVEILSPAGSYDSLIAAIAAGADAVYIGGSRFGARAYADNLQEEQLLEAIDYVHLHGRKIYLTINTLLKEHELKNELYDYLLTYYKQGLDAVIVQDIGVLQFVKEHFPDLPIHASTQMTITNRLGAEFLEKLGVERVVTAREMQLHEIEDITKYTNLEIESFVHGALCYCYSGQCLYSSLIGGRSGNRGQCAQPCRLPYKVNGEKDSQYVLSLKDICTLEYIPELVESGIYSFKIEGRMKKPEYVALVTSMYRKYVDLYLEKGKKGFRIEPKDREMLMDLYNRGGSHGGYYHTKNGREMVSLSRPNHAGVPALQIIRQNGKSVTGKALVDIHRGDIIELPDGNENFTFANEVKTGDNITFVTHKMQTFQRGHVLNRTRNEKLLQEIKHSIIERKIKEKISGQLQLKVNTPAKMILSYQNITVEVSGEVVQEAVNQPMDVERIERQMRKTGNTEFEFEQLQIDLAGSVFLPMQSLNELRRSGLEALQKQIVESYRREWKAYNTCAPANDVGAEATGFYVYVEQLEQLEEALGFDRVSRIYLDCNTLPALWENKELSGLIERVHVVGKEIYLCMPHVLRSETIQKYDVAYIPIFESGWDGVLVRNYESYTFLKNHGYQKKIVTDHNLYQFNQYAKNFWKQEGVEHTTAPVELNYKELQEVGLENSELVVYGYLPMMVSAQCVQKTVNGCNKRKGTLILKDRYQKNFTVKNNCDYCYNVIYNTTPVVLTDQKAEILHLNPKALRLHFTIENKQTVRNVIQMYEDIFFAGEDGREPEGDFTRGHFKRGIK